MVAAGRLRSELATTALCGILGAALSLVACTPPKTTPPAGPAASLATEVWDFGTIRRAETARTTIEIANRGSDTLRVTLFPSCDCVTATLEPASLPPGGSALILLSLLGYEIKDATSKTLFVDSNDPARPRIPVTIKGRVVQGSGPDLVILPNPVPAYGAPGASAADPKRGNLTIRNAGQEDLVVRGIRCFGCTADMATVVIPPSGEAAITIDTVPDWQDGRWIEIESNDPVFPLRKISIVEME